MAYSSALSGLAFSIPRGSLHLFDHIFDLLRIPSQWIFFPLITTFCRFLCLIISLLHVPLNLTKEKEGWACCLIRASFTGHKVSAAPLGYDMASPSAFPGVSLVQTLVIWVVVMHVDSGSNISDWVPAFPLNRRFSVLICSLVAVNDKHINIQKALETGPSIQQALSEHC